jgi:hypothetical protein
MLAQDPYSGALYDVPEMSGYGEVPFDGLGFSFGNLLGNLLPGVGNLIGGLFGGGGAPSPAPPIPAPPFSPPSMIPGMPQLPFLPPVPPPFMSPIQDILSRFGPQPPAPPPWVPGWTQPAPWVTRSAPRTVYMRCGVWPGQPGLVPVTAMNQLPVNGAVPAVPVVPTVPALMGGGRRRHHPRRYR